MFYYEINFYGNGHELDWSFYIKSKKELKDEQIKTKLENDFIGVDGLEQHHINNIVSIENLTAKQFTALSGLSAGDESMGFIIISTDGYWNNELGWVESKSDATIFEDKEYQLPIGRNVQWIPRDIEKFAKTFWTPYSEVVTIKGEILKKMK